jgi:predicted alpha/beta hydrolase family esterase
MLFMKRAIVVHCWDGYPGYCWYQDTKRTLEHAGFVVDVPSMPDTHEPELSKWLPKLREVAGEPDGDLFLIGHSAGVITILRYLEGLRDGQKVGGAVFVAGFTEDLGFKELKSFFEKPINFEKITAHTKTFVAINSDDDPYVPVKYGEELRDQLQAKLIIKHKMKHFSGHVGDPGACESLPDVADAVIAMARA